MHHTDEIDLGNFLPGVDLALWLQLIVAAVLVIALGAWAITAA
ncbi:MAG: hypothetical protein ACTHK4_04025 [Mycobacteriales bacterium]